MPTSQISTDKFIFFTSKENFRNNISINLLNVSHNERKALYLIRTAELNKKESDLVYVNNKLTILRQIDSLTISQTKDLESLEGKVISIRKGIRTLKREIDVICKANILANNNMNTQIEENDSLLSDSDNSSISPIGENIESQLDTIINNHLEIFEEKMYSILCCNATEVVVPVLNKILNHHGYRVSKIPAKK